MGPRWKVALLVQTSSDWHRLLLQGIASYALVRGHWDFFVEHRGLRESLRLPSWWQGDGVIGRLASPEILSELESRAIPRVNVSWLGEHSVQCPKVVSDEERCGALAAEHFLDKGFEHFAFLGPNPELGYRDTLAASYFQCISSRGFHYVRFEHGKNAVTELGTWLSDLPKPCALLVWDSEWGRMVLNRCTDLDLRVPEDLAVLSVEHDSLMSVLAPVPISSLDQDPLRVGYEAAACLEQQMRHGPQEIAPRLIAPLRVSQRSSSDTIATNDEYVAKALAFIREKGARPIQVRDLLEHCHVSRRVLEYRFQRVLGRSPAAEIRRFRLDLVKRLLRETDLSQGEISRRAGFNHLEVMARAFRRSFGMTLGQYRSPFKMSVQRRSQGK